MEMRAKVVANDRTYNWPRYPTVVICCDGSEPAYMEQALADGLMHNLKQIIAKGVDLRGKSVIPSFTNPNNLSIVTGRPPAVHGISGNYFYDKTINKEVMMNDPSFLRAPTIFEKFQRAGARIVIVTGKEKLRTLLGHGLDFSRGTAICISSEKSDESTIAGNGIEHVNDLVGMDVPDVYSLELSEFVFVAGTKLMTKVRPDLMYLSTTDFIQHKFGPGSAGANAFYAMMDRYLGELDRSGAVIVLTADHGMKDKHIGGQPDVIYLQDLLDAWYGKESSRVILPITDPYVVHHGALGSFATVYLDDKLDAELVLQRIQALPKVQIAVSGDEGCKMFDLPRDRMGDIIVVSSDSKVIGTRESEHDLSGLNEPLRSHGGLSEQTIPIILNRKLTDQPSNLHNYDAFDLGLNRAMA